MFSIKDIAFGEELCFNYCSVTESEKEYEAACCLCGTVECSGRYLQLASDKKFLQVMKKYHNFVDRNALLFLAIQDSERDGISEKEQKLLEESGFKECLMQGVPIWLTKWTVYILKYILFEESVYPELIKDENPHYTMEALQLDAKNIRDGKI